MIGDIVVKVSKKKLAEGTACGFEARVRGTLVKGILVRKGNRYFAYHNLCQHLAVPLDLQDGNFFTHDARYLQCHMHGAMYEPETGFCVAGPCQGARLVALKVEEGATHLVIHIPESLAKG